MKIYKITIQNKLLSKYLLPPRWAGTLVVGMCKFEMLHTLLTRQKTEDRGDNTIIDDQFL